MTTFTQLVDEVRLALYGYGLSQPRAAFLSSAVTDTGLSFTVADASSFSQGVAEIGDELVYIDSVDRDTGVLTIAPDGRGYYGSTAAAHDAGTRIEMAPTWPRQQVKAEINAAIVNTYPTLFGVAQDSFTYNPSVTTYEIDASAERVLQVTADSIGPSQEPVQITRYRMISVAPTADFTSTNALTLFEAPFPGRTVTVTYAKQPSALTDGDDFTDSGLRESAKTAIKYAACSNLLAYMDPARVPVDTASADAYDPSHNPLGQASRLSLQLWQRYEVELAKERDRLRVTTPVNVIVRKR